MTCHIEKTDSWTSYPSPGEEMEAHTACVFNSLCQLNITLSHFKLPKELEENEAQVLIIHLRAWFDHLPPCISDKGITPPHILSLLYVFHYYLLVNFR